MTTTPSITGKWIRRAGLFFLCATFMLAAAAFAVWMSLRLSLAQLDGELPVKGLSAPVKISRDANGVPSVMAASRIDLARATGFLHAQDRFFQMDLLRRAASGELPGLLGPGTLKMSQLALQFRLRQAAIKAYETASETDRALLNAYADGVNAGLASLRVRPPEYLLLRQKPAPWKSEDSFLILHAMGLQLSSPMANQKADMAIVRQILPPAAYHFYVRQDTLAPAALDRFTPTKPRIPEPGEFDLRAQTSSTNQQSGSVGNEKMHPGSNAWAVDGKHTRNGVAMVANDMHLGLALPNVWYRMQLSWTEKSGKTNKLIGVTLPGNPAMVAGSNTRVAWGFTAAQLDVSDQVVLETDPKHPNACRVGSEWRPFEMVREEVAVSGSTNAIFLIPWSPWGPVGTNALGQTVSYRWALQLPEAANLRMAEFESCSSVEELLRVAPWCGVTWVNVLAADNKGNIGWTLGGRFPKRFGMDPRFPASWADGKSGWNGWQDPGEIPRIINPPDGILWNANHRALGTPAYQEIAGADLTDNGARGSQIRDRLLALTNATPKDLMSIQLDDRALQLAPWQQRLLLALERGTNEARFAEARPLVEKWGGRASVDSAGYRIVRAFRSEVQEQLLSPVKQLCLKKFPNLFGIPGHSGGAVEDLLLQRPIHLLPAQFESYEAMMVQAARNVLASFPAQKPLSEMTWGDRNRVKVQHPLGKAVPFLGRWLDLPERQLPGDREMPRAQGVSFGASERFVIPPGHEEEAIFNMPGGQSGHFLSPFYTLGHRDWEEGNATPLLPGPAEHELVLKP